MITPQSLKKTWPGHVIRLHKPGYVSNKCISYLARTKQALFRKLDKSDIDLAHAIAQRRTKEYAARYPDNYTIKAIKL